MAGEITTDLNIILQEIEKFKSNMLTSDEPSTKENIEKMQDVAELEAAVVESIVEKYMIKAIDKNIFMTDLFDALENDTWFPMREQFDQTDDGTYGNFAQLNLFGLKKDSSSDSDIVTTHEVDGIMREFRTELKTAQTHVKDMTIGQVTAINDYVLEDVQSMLLNYEYASALLLHKMLRKMQNFVFIRVRGQTRGDEVAKEGFVRFESITSYTSLIIEFVKYEIDNFLKIDAIKSKGKFLDARESAALKDLQSRRVGMITIGKTKGKNNSITFKTALNLNVFLENYSTGFGKNKKIKYNSDRLYRRRRELFNTPEMRGQFWRTARLIAHSMNLETN